MVQIRRRPKRRELEAWQDPEQEPYIRIEGVSKSFGNVEVLSDIWLDIYKEEFFTLLGPSGCGKTTLLRLLAGFETPDQGKIFIDGIEMGDMPPHRRPVNMMFQSYALFPHMTVSQNVAFGLQQEHLDKQEIRQRVEEALDLVQMLDYAKRKPSQLSGGQQQRVALARCLVKRPKLVLLDEPLAALDKKLRERTQLELVDIQESVGVTFIMVTHDQEEAMTMSTRMAIMESGTVRQIGTPHEVYEYPNSAYVADFIGSMNIFEGIVQERTTDHVTVKCDQLENEIYVSHGGDSPVGATVNIALRPEKVSISTRKPKDTYNWDYGEVEDIEYLGDVSIYHVRLEDRDQIVEAMLPNLHRMEAPAITWEDKVYVYWKPDNAILLVA